MGVPICQPTLWRCGRKSGAYLLHLHEASILRLPGFLLSEKTLCRSCLRVLLQVADPYRRVVVRLDQPHECTRVHPVLFKPSKIVRLKPSPRWGRPCRVQPSGCRAGVACDCAGQQRVEDWMGCINRVGSLLNQAKRRKRWRQDRNDATFAFSVFFFSPLSVACRLPAAHYGALAVDVSSLVFSWIMLSPPPLALWVPPRLPCPFHLPNGRDGTNSWPCSCSNADWPGVVLLRVDCLIGQANVDFLLHAPFHCTPGCSMKFLLPTICRHPSLAHRSSFFGWHALRERQAVGLGPCEICVWVLRGQLENNMSNMRRMRNERKTTQVHTYCLQVSFKIGSTGTLCGRRE